MKKIILIALVFLISCSKDDPTPTAVTCKMHQVSQYANVTYPYNINTVVWYQMTGNASNVFYSNNCVDENKIVFTNTTITSYDSNGVGKTAYLRRNIILKQ
jgi:hypothetical protein